MYKKPIGCLLIFFAALFLCSCSFKNSNGEINDSQPQSFLKVAMGARGTSSKLEDEAVYKYAKDYMELHPEVVIEFEYTQCKTLNEYRAYVENLPMRLRNADGADIVRVSLYTSLQSLAETGLLADIDLLARSDPDFTTSDHFENIIEGITFDGKLRYMPLAFNYSYISINKDYIRYMEDGETIPDIISFETMMSVYTYANNEYRDSGILYMTDYRDYETGFNIAMNVDGIDYENRVVNIYNQENLQRFNKLTEIPLYPSNNYKEYLDDMRNALFSRDTHIIFGTSSGIGLNNAVWFDNSNACFTCPVALSDAEGNVSFNVSNALAISEISKNKELAWDFIRFCVEEKEVNPETGEPIGLYHSGLPLNRQNFYSMLSVSLGEAYDELTEAGQIQSGDKKADVNAAIKKRETLALKCNRLGQSNSVGLAGIVEGELGQYREGSQTSSETLENIHTKITNYLQK